jgi:hypothetical protein
MAKSKSTSFTIAAFCFAVAFISFAVLILIRNSQDDLSQVLVPVSFCAAILTVILAIAGLFRKTDKRGMTIVMLLVSLIIVIVYGWMYASKWILEQGVNEMMNGQ